MDRLHRNFINSAPDLSGVGVTPAVIDCNGKLPSGQTVRERFFKDKMLREPIFFVAVQLPRSFSVKSHATPKVLGSFASNVTAVKVSRMMDADEFCENCLRRKQFALDIFDGNYTEGGSAAVKAVAMQHRGVAVADLDTRKLRLSIEDALPPNKGEPRLVYLSLDSSGKDDNKKDEESSRKNEMMAEHNYRGKAFRGLNRDDTALSELSTVAAQNWQKSEVQPQVFDRKEEEKSERKKEGEVREKFQEEGVTNQDLVCLSLALSLSRSRALARALSLALLLSLVRGVCRVYPQRRAPVKPGGHRDSTAKRTGRGTKARKMWSADEQIKAKQVERERERRIREKMMQEAEQADSIEYVGEDVSEVDARPRRDPLEDDEEEELEEVVVDDDSDLILQRTSRINGSSSRTNFF